MSFACAKMGLQWMRLCTVWDAEYTQALTPLCWVLRGKELWMLQSGLTKVVLARRSDIAFRGHLDPLLLLAALQVQTLFSLTNYIFNLGVCAQ